jgi:hypothetical protein
LRSVHEPTEAEKRELVGQKFGATSKLLMFRALSITWRSRFFEWRAAFPPLEPGEQPSKTFSNRRQHTPAIRKLLPEPQPALPSVKSQFQAGSHYLQISRKIIPAHLQHWR